MLIITFKIPSYKTNSIVLSRAVSVETNLISSGEMTKQYLHEEEIEFAELLDSIAPGILPLNESAVMEPIPTTTLESLFLRNVKFSDKVNSIKNFLRQPLRTALVAEAPSLDKNVVRHETKVFAAIELLYVLRCIVAVLPQSKPLCGEIIQGLVNTDPKLITADLLKEASGALTKLRGLDAAISAVASAAVKVFYMVDGMAFDDFSLSLTVLEWEQITMNMNAIRLQFAEKISELAKPTYHLNNSKAKRLSDKRDLDEAINKARIPLLRIMKLTIEDLHMDTRLLISSSLKLSDSSKKIRYDRKDLLSKVKSTILSEYRKDNNLDILKYAQVTSITF